MFRFLVKFWLYYLGDVRLSYMGHEGGFHFKFLSSLEYEVWNWKTSVFLIV